MTSRFDRPSPPGPIARRACAIVFACGAIFATVAFAADPTPTTDAALEGDLLEGLGDLKLPAAPAPKPAPADREPAPAARAPEGSGDAAADAPSVEELKLLLQNEGEDLGSAGESATERIGSMMRSVEERFVGKDSSAPTQQMQEDIVTQLRAMLEQQQKKCSQCSGGQCDSPSSSSSSSGSKPGASQSGDPKSKPKSGSPGEKQPGDENKEPNAESDSPSSPGAATDPRGTSATVATDSEDRLDPSQLSEVLRRSAADFDELWGQLPPHVQERLKQGLTERTLPQYEGLIEAYYRRLAEDSDEAR